MKQKHISILSKLVEIIDDQLNTAKSIKDAMDDLFDIYSEECGHLTKVIVTDKIDDPIDTIKECHHSKNPPEDEDYVDCTCDNCPFFNELDEDGSFSDSLRRDLS